MLITFFNFVVLSAPVILLALALGLAGSSIKDKVLLGLVGALFVVSAIALFIRDIVTGNTSHHSFTLSETKSE